MRQKRSRKNGLDASRRDGNGRAYKSRTHHNRRGSDWWSNIALWWQSKQRQDHDNLRSIHNGSWSRLAKKEQEELEKARKRGLTKEQKKAEKEEEERRRIQDKAKKWG